MRYLIIVFLLSGCAITLKIDKPFQANQVVEPIKSENSFRDNRDLILKALVKTKCPFEINATNWKSWLNSYGNDDVEGFFSWLVGKERKEGLLYSVSGGKGLSDYFKQVKLLYEYIKKGYDEQ